MSQSFPLLFVWSKGASTRRKIFKIIASENNKGNSIYISKITTVFNSTIGNDEKKHTNSSIRKNVQLLKKYELIQAINEGGRPEYLELTNQGKSTFEKILVSGKKAPKLKN